MHPVCTVLHYAGQGTQHGPHAMSLTKTSCSMQNSFGHLAYPDHHHPPFGKSPCQHALAFVCLIGCSISHNVAGARCMCIPAAPTQRTQVVLPLSFYAGDLCKTECAVVPLRNCALLHNSCVLSVLSSPQVCQRVRLRVVHPCNLKQPHSQPGCGRALTAAQMLRLLHNQCPQSLAHW
jgi:hypothetical protein